MNGGNCCVSLSKEKKSQVLRLEGCAHPWQSGEMVSNSGKVWLLLHSEQQQRGAWIFVKYPVQYFEIADTIERTSAKCSCAREFKFTIVKITPYLHHLSIKFKFLQCANQCNVSTDKHHQLSRYLVDYTITHGLVNRSIQAPLRQQKPLISVTMMWLCCTGQETGPAKTHGWTKFPWSSGDVCSRWEQTHAKHTPQCIIIIN